MGELFRAPVERLIMSDLPGKLIGSALRALWLPAAVFGSGVLVMRILSGHDYVTKQLRERTAPGDRKPLNMRFRGYNAGAVDRHWGALDRRAMEHEQRFLQLDLAFPLFYGAALAISLSRTWKVPDSTSSPRWLLAPIIVTVIADWLENLIHLSQLRHFMKTRKASLSSGWLRVASLATVVKLYSFTATTLLLIVLAAARAVPRPMKTSSSVMQGARNDQA